jgi:hypothetical protein
MSFSPPAHRPARMTGRPLLAAAPPPVPLPGPSELSPDDVSPLSGWANPPLHRGGADGCSAVRGPASFPSPSRSPGPWAGSGVLLRTDSSRSFRSRERARGVPSPSAHAAAGRLELAGFPTAGPIRLPGLATRLAFYASPGLVPFVSPGQHPWGFPFGVFLLRTVGRTLRRALPRLSLTHAEGPQALGHAPPSGVSSRRSCVRPAHRV